MNQWAIKCVDGCSVGVRQPEDKGWFSHRSSLATAPVSALLLPAQWQRAQSVDDGGLGPAVSGCHAIYE